MKILAGIAVCLIVLGTYDAQSPPLLAENWLNPQEKDTPRTAQIDVVIKVHRKSMMLELVEGGMVVLSFPVRVGSPKTPTPLGEGIIYEKRERAIFRYLDGPKEGQIIKYSTCEDGIRRKINYRQIFALGIRIRGMEQYSIHSVTCPETVGRAISHGCIGVTIANMLLLYPRVPRGTKVVITDD